MKDGDFVAISHFDCHGALTEPDIPIHVGSGDDQYYVQVQTRMRANGTVEVDCGGSYLDDQDMCNRFAEPLPCPWRIKSISD